MITHTNIYTIGQYSKHLKHLTREDKLSRFGHIVSDYNIDQLILSMCYHPDEHELWFCSVDGQRVGWGHMAKNKDNSWELAVSVDREHQRKGVGNKLIKEMLEWAKFQRVNEVYMHCIEENRVIQHLATKHELRTRERGEGERTAAIEVPEPTIFETNSQLFKQQSEIIKEIGQLQKQLANLWLTPTSLK